MSTQQTSTGKSLPAFAPLNNQNSEKLPAQFVLKLSQPMPLSISSINQLIELAERMGEPSSIKEYFTSLTSSRESLINLVARQPIDSTKGVALGSRFDNSSSMNGDSSESKKQIYSIQLKGEIHTYQIVNTYLDKQEGVFVEKIPFTHPTSIPSILMILRQQALFNCIMGSCTRPNKSKQNGTNSSNSECSDENAEMFEVAPVNLASICVSFEHPSKESLATLEIDLRDINEPKCQLHARDVESLCSNSFASKIIQKCWSVPITLRCVLRKCNETRRALLEEANKKREKELEDLLKANNSSQPESSFQPKLQNQDTLSTRLTKQSTMSMNDHEMQSQNQQNSSKFVSNKRNFSQTSSNLGESPNKSMKVDGVQDNKSNFLKRFSCQPRVNANSPLCPTPNLTRVINKLNNKEAQRKASMTKQSNTILMSMLSDVPSSGSGPSASSSSLSSSPTTGPKAVKRSRSGNVTKKISISSSSQINSEVIKVPEASTQAPQVKVESPNKLGSNNLKAKHPRPTFDQFAIKQGSSGLKLTVKKTKLSGHASISTSSSASPSTSTLSSSQASANPVPSPAVSTQSQHNNMLPSVASSSSTASNTSCSSNAVTSAPATLLSSSSGPTNSSVTPSSQTSEASKIFSTTATSGIKYKIPKISKTQVTSQSSGQASSSDTNPSSVSNNEHSNNNGTANHDDNDPSSSVSSTNAASSTTSKSSNTTPFVRNNQQRNSVTSSTHPYGRANINPLSFTTNKASSSTTVNNRISSSNNNLNNNNSGISYQLNRPEYHISLPNQQQQQSMPQVRAVMNSSVLPASTISYSLMPVAGSSATMQPASTANPIQYVPTLVSQTSFSNIPVATGSAALVPTQSGPTPLVPTMAAAMTAAIVSPSLVTAPVSTNYTPMIGKTTQQPLTDSSSANNCDTSSRPIGSVASQMNVSSSSDLSASKEAATLSTPSSPTDCNQVDSLPPPPLIPIDSLEEKTKSNDIESPSSEQADDGASDRLSIVDTNENNLADSNSVSASTPRPSDVESPRIVDLANDVSQDKNVASSSNTRNGIEQRDAIRLD